MKPRHALAALIAAMLLGFGFIISQAGTAGNDSHSSTDIIRNSTPTNNENSGFGGIK